MSTRILRIDGVNRRIREEVIGEELAALLAVPLQNLSPLAGRRRAELLREAWQASQPKTCAKVADVGFREGDMVRLRSGGHRMMVVSDACCGCVELIYSFNGEICEAGVPLICLEHAPPPSDSDIPF